MLTTDAPLAPRSLAARQTPQVDSVDLCELLRVGLDGSDRAGLVRVQLPHAPAHCAGQLPRVRQLVAALLSVAKRESPQRLGSELNVACLPSHISITITSDRVTQTPELGPLLEAFNAYASSCTTSRSSSREGRITYTPRMKITSCLDRRFSRVRVGLPHAPKQDRAALRQEHDANEHVAPYAACRGVG